MLGGARMVRFVVLQESRMTASATAPPAPHNKLSRLLWIHRVRLECHTNREYAQKGEMLTTHFFGFFPTRISGVYYRVYRPGGPGLCSHDIASAICPRIF